MWANIEDFATLYQYFWYRDFPMDQKGKGAHVSDWTAHVGHVVRQVADAMGYMARFEHGGRIDAVLRSRAGDEVAIEWEWNGVFGRNNEIAKLRGYRVRPKEKERLKYAVLITYTHTPYIDQVYRAVSEKWGNDSRWPLLLVLVDVKDVPKSSYATGRELQNMQMVVFEDSGPPRPLRSARALPWEIEGTRWA